ncbi:SRPBCC domain-containing protein [Rhodococcus sp. SGAir0479]|uniref:SRPBCC domain-containing protein n=1 Tax=Rhodococcus sp. SGAir0479 TaxID=2567884 RepID=UPI0010CD4367|nr:SRPBCC domain-containing protein [Rhodococcus sp. SGAir0479]QCQ93198.1 ATPase [Rhodococcus sp. SGAir0479]
MDELDRIEREIAIDAPAARVWKLVSEPGWYINDEEIVPHRVERRGELDVVRDPVHGEFAFATVELHEPRYAAFRWFTDVDSPDGSSTLVEFRIAETSPTSVVLTVVESGFASLSESAQARRSRYDDHVGGWRVEMALAKRHAEEAVDAVG